MKNKKLIFFGMTVFFLIGIIPFIQSQANIDCYECMDFDNCPEGCVCYDDYAIHEECNCYSENPSICECITADGGGQGVPTYEYIPSMQLPEDFICYDKKIKDADYDLGHCTRYACALGGICDQNSELWWTKSYADDYSDWICCGDDRNDSDGVLIKSADGYSSVCCPNSNYIYDELNGECKQCIPKTCEDYKLPCGDYRTLCGEMDNGCGGTIDCPCPQECAAYSGWYSIIRPYTPCLNSLNGCVRDNNSNGKYDKFCRVDEVYDICI